MNTLPTYKATLVDEESGIYAVSLVDSPATETPWICFSKEDMLYSISDEDKHLLCGPIMLANTPIYRRHSNGFEYNIVYTKEVIRDMAMKALNDNTLNNIDIQHNGDILPKGTVSIVELYIVDKDKGINPNFIEVEDGSLMGTYKINDPELWQECKNGGLHGFSLAGYFGVEETNEIFNSENKTIKNINETKKITAKFMDILNTLKQLVIDIEAEEQNPEVVAEETVEVVAEEQPAEESTDEPEQTPEEPKDSAELDAIKESIAALENTIADITERITAIEETLQETAVAPVEEEQIEETEDKFSRFAKLIK